MNKGLSSHLKNSFPVGVVPMVSGVVIGLSGGIASLLIFGETADRATAIGIVFFLSASLGFWLGGNLYLMLARGYSAWLQIIRERLSRLMPPLAGTNTSAGRSPETSGKRSRALLHILIAAVCWVTPFSCIVFSSGVIASLLWTQIVATSLGKILMALCTVSLPLAIAIVLQVSLLLWFHQKAIWLERRVNRAQMDAPAVSEPEAFASGLSRAGRLAQWFGGINRLAASQPRPITDPAGR